jgi:hypothetical protein
VTDTSPAEPVNDTNDAADATETVDPTAEVAAAAADAPPASAYDILHARLAQVAHSVQEVADVLNQERADVFGGASLTLIEQERLSTAAACIPCDAVSVDGHLLFGTNIPSGLVAKRTVADVFTLLAISDISPTDKDFAPLDPDDPSYFLRDPSFQRDFEELYTYYADCRLLELRKVGELLLMVFGIGERDDDIRVLRWRLDAEAPLYIDAYGEHDLVSPEPFDFEWHEVDRTQRIEGRWPHWNLHDLVFVGGAKGVLEFRVDDVVEGGRMVHTEQLSVVDGDLGELALQTARIGELLLVRLKPYGETTERYYVYNRLTQQVHRIDAIGLNCHQLPEGSGIMFPGGFHLQNGETKVFATDAAGYELLATHTSPNGEDLLYAFHRLSTGDYLLLAYNLVSRTMENPVASHGYALFEDGVIVTIRPEDEPQRVHTIGVYTSPFCTPERYTPATPPGSFFGRIGNPELVRALGELLSLARDASDPEFSAPVFEALVARANRLLDSHAWLQEPDAHGLAELLVQLRRTAGTVLDEFATVAEAKREAHMLVLQARTDVDGYLSQTGLELRETEAFLDLMERGRVLLGRLDDLAQRPHIEPTVIEEMRVRVNDAFLALGARALEFLGDATSLDSTTAGMEAAFTSGMAAEAAVDVRAAMTEVDHVGERLSLLTEVVGALEVDDPTGKTSVLQRLGEALARRNAVRADLDQRLIALRKQEAAAGFQAAMNVLAQRASAALMAASDAAGCDAALGALEADLETSELRYGDVPEFSEMIAAKRDELYAAFLAKRDQLAAERTSQIERVANSARRVVQTVATRAANLDALEKIDGFFAADALVIRVRNAIRELTELGEAGRAGELEVELAAAKDAARRAVADRSELFSEGGVKIGRWQIGVNTEPFELRLRPTDDGDDMELRLTGTDLVLPVPDSGLSNFADLAAQSYPTENALLTRGVYLAFTAVDDGVPIEGLTDLASRRVDDGYEMGVHDSDAAKILEATAPVFGAPGLRWAGAVRAVAGVWWSQLDDDARASLAAELAAVRALGRGATRTALVEHIGPPLLAVATDAGLDPFFDLDAAVQWLSESADEPAVTADGGAIAEAFSAWAREAGIPLDGVAFPTLVRWIADRLAVDGGLGGSGVANAAYASFCLADRAAEAAWRLFDPQVKVTKVAAVARVEGLRGQHPLVVGGVLELPVGRAHTVFRIYRREGLDRFKAFNEARRATLARWRDDLGLDTLRPRVLTSFVRNRLVDEVLLPMVGDNLSRQLGLSGAPQGLLLLISPPGYGKTTLVEYVADLLGFALVKINGPALGESVTSLDPGKAPDQAAAAELVKLNRAFAMGNNVICYIDDIQHTSAEFLQKFISLCDATRRIEGVVDGEAQTFELGRRRFVMVMAGNPYTSSGTDFRIPDMLANRADVHNLGDVAGTHEAAFAQSYIENACGVNEVLAPVIGRGRQELEALLAVALGGTLRSESLQHHYSPTELAAVTKTLAHVVRARDALLKVNNAYIESATVDDALRGEPAFLLQGSYRNMARLAGRIVAAMNPDEVDAAVREHYQSEAQTLASAAGWNLAKLPLILGTASEADRTRVDELRAQWREANVGADPLSVIAASLRNIEAEMRSDREPPLAPHGRPETPAVVVLHDESAVIAAASMAAETLAHREPVKPKAVAKRKAAPTTTEPEPEVPSTPAPPAASLFAAPAPVHVDDDDPAVPPLPPVPPPPDDEGLPELPDLPE